MGAEYLSNSGPILKDLIETDGPCTLFPMKQTLIELLIKAIGPQHFMEECDQDSCPVSLLV